MDPRAHSCDGCGAVAHRRIRNFKLQFDRRTPHEPGAAKSVCHYQPTKRAEERAATGHDHFAAGRW